MTRLARPRAAALGALASLLCACAADERSPFTAVVIAFDAKSQQYKLAQVRVATLSSVRRLEGTSGTMRGGGAATVDPALIDDGAATVANLAGRFITAPPGGVSLSYNLLNDLVYPEDFLSLELLSAYVNVERARAAFTLWGVTSLAAAPLYAHTALEDQRGLSPLRAGEMFYPPLGAFFFPSAAEKAQQLPVHFNLGAMTHALAHQAVQAKAWGGKPRDPAPRGTVNDAAAVVGRHVWAAVAEGIADFLGAAAGEDPRWFEKSLQQEAAARNLDQLRCGDAQMLAALEVEERTGQPAYDPYPLGTVLGAALWEASADGLKAVAIDTLAALGPLGAAAAQNEGKLSLAVALDTLVTAATDEHKPVLCGLLQDRFKSMSITALSACSGVAVSPPLETCQ